MIPAYCCGAWIWYGFHPYLANYHNTTHLLIITGNLSLVASTWFCHDWYTNTIAGIKINVMECVNDIESDLLVFGGLKQCSGAMHNIHFCSLAIKLEGDTREQEQTKQNYGHIEWIILSLVIMRHAMMFYHVNVLRHGWVYGMVHVIQ